MEVTLRVAGRGRLLLNSLDLYMPIHVCNKSSKHFLYLFCEQYEDFWVAAGVGIDTATVSGFGRLIDKFFFLCLNLLMCREIDSPHLYK